MSNLKKAIDFKLLENELDDALKADELYKLQNDAKIRAIEQRVPTYDHFRGMVQAAHLRPLERSEMQKKVEVSWNHCLNTNEGVVSKICHQANFVSGSKDKSSYLSNSSFKPRNTTEFLNILANLSNSQEKFDYLLRFSDDLQSKYFKIEVPTEFLEEFFQVAIDNCSVETSAQVIEILHSFSECNRFSLSLVMVSTSKKCFIQKLFDKLFSLIPENCKVDKLQELAKTYSVSLTVNKDNK